MEKNIKIRFQGKEYWRVIDAISPLDNCTEDGELIDCFAESYAHIFSDGVYRFGQKIGEEKDIEIITPNTKE